MSPKLPPINQGGKIRQPKMNFYTGTVELQDKVTELQHELVQAKREIALQSKALINGDDV